MSFALVVSTFQKISNVPFFIILVTWQQVYLVSVNDCFWTHEQHYFFQFFRNFAFEYPQIRLNDHTTGVLDLTYIGKEVYNRNLREIAGFEYNSFFMNSFYKVFFLGCFIVIMVGITAVDSSLTFLCRKYKVKMITRLARRFYWSAPLTVLSVFFYPLCLTTILEIYQQKTNTPDEKVSFLMCAMSAISLFLFWLMTIIIVAIHAKNRKFRIIKRKFNFLLGPMKGGFVSSLFWPFILAKFFVNSFLQGAVFNFATGPLVIQAATTGMILLFLLVSRPFKSHVTNLIAIYGEITVGGLQLLSLNCIAYGELPLKQKSSNAIINLRVL